MRFFVLLMGLVLPLLACAEKTTPEFKEGVHYTVIQGQPEPPKTGKIEVTEVFWYGCGHCYAFEPVVGPWKATLPEDVKFIGSPAIWRDQMVPHAKLYYTASALNVLDKMHPIFFEALHKAPNAARALQTPEEIKALVTKHDIDGDVFVKTMDSFAVNSQVQQAVARQKSYGITGTPELVVGGKYLISASKAGGHKEMLKVADFLIEQIRESRGS